MHLAVEALSANLERDTIKRCILAISHAMVTPMCYSEEERLESIRDRQVREWLSATFTRSDSVYESHGAGKTSIVKFKAAANTIIISNYLGG